MSNNPDPLPRLPYSQKKGKLNEDQFTEINYWLSLFEADPILLNCQLNHIASDCIGDRNHWHDQALKRAEQLQITFWEIKRFGKPVTTDFRIRGNPKYADYLAEEKASADSTRKCTYGLSASNNHADSSNQKLKDLESLGFLVKFNVRMKNRDFDAKLADLLNSCGTPEFTSKFSKLKSIHTRFAASSNHSSERLDYLLKAASGVTFVPQRFSCSDVPKKLNYCCD